MKTTQHEAIPTCRGIRSENLFEDVPHLLQLRIREAFRNVGLQQGECPVSESLPQAGRPCGFPGVNPLPLEQPRRPVPADKIVDAAMDLIRSAKRPIILAGNGAIRRRAAKQLRIFAEKTGIGVINTFMGKGSLPRSSRRDRVR